MDFSQFKHILKENTHYVIVENGKPSYIVIPIEEYNNWIKREMEGKTVLEKDFKKINQQEALLYSSEDVNMDFDAEIIKNKGFQDIRVEDLPF